MSFTVIALGRLKEKYLEEACMEYLKRLSPCGTKIIELSPEKLPDNPSEKEIITALEKEGAKIKEKIPKGAYVYTMCIEGREMSSVDFSREIDSIRLRGYSEICFIIGSSHGLANSVKEISNGRFSMSKMTFPHQIARVMLLEQLYRATQISLGSKYHK